MKFQFCTIYTKEELIMIEENGCEIVSEIKLSKLAFEESPRRMIKYGGAFIAEIFDKEDNRFYWAVLGKDRKGAYTFTSLYEDIQTMVEGI